MTSTAHWSNDIIVSLSLAYYAPFASLPLLTEIPSFHPKGDRQTDRPTDMCNPTDAIASKNYPSHAKHIMVSVWSPCESTLEECHVEQTTVVAEELEDVVFECQGVVKI